MSLLSAAAAATRRTDNKILCVLLFTFWSYRLSTLRTITRRARMTSLMLLFFLISRCRSYCHCSRISSNRLPLRNTLSEVRARVDMNNLWPNRRDFVQTETQTAIVDCGGVGRRPTVYVWLVTILLTVCIPTENSVGVDSNISHRRHRSWIGTVNPAVWIGGKINRIDCDTVYKSVEIR